MTVTIRQIGPCLAGDVDGIDMTKPLTADEVAAIHAGMDRYAVLVFHNQDIDDDLAKSVFHPDGTCNYTNRADAADIPFSHYLGSSSATRARFHIVPAGYPAGMFATTEGGCRTCHEQTSRPLNNLDPRVVLYGEVWGEDEVFTWHPFAIDVNAFGVADGNRKLNPRLAQARLVEMATPASDPQIYKTLQKPYSPIYDP